MRWLLSMLLLVVHLAWAEVNPSNQVVLLDLGENTPRQALLLGAGYRGEWCLETNVEPGWRAAGNAIDLFDIATGTAIWSALGPGAITKVAAGGAVYSQAQMTHSIVAPVTPADSDGNGLVDRAYVADTGGIVWRLNLAEAGREFRGEARDILDRYTAKPLALLGGEGAADRQFYDQLDYVRSRDGSGDYDGIFLVSGNRARPGATGVQNYAYLVKDRQGQPVSHDQLPDITGACLRSDSPGCLALDLRRGWKLALQGAGEKGVSRPLVSRGVVYFTTYTPPPGDEFSCAESAGEGQVYAIKLADGGPLMHPLETGEAEPETDAGQDPQRSFPVGPGVPGAVVAERDQLLLPLAGDEVVPLANPDGPLRWRIYWREEGVDMQ